MTSSIIFIADIITGIPAWDTAAPHSTGGLLLAAAPQQVAGVGATEPEEGEHEAVGSPEDVVRH